jgi:hypothetical protein
VGAVTLTNGTMGTRNFRGSEMEDLEVEATNTIVRVLGRKKYGFFLFSWQF